MPPRLCAICDFPLRPVQKNCCSIGCRRELQDRNRPTGFAALSKRESQVFALFLEGHQLKQIGAALGISPKSAQVYKVNLMRKLGARHHVDLVREGLKNGLIVL